MLPENRYAEWRTDHSRVQAFRDGSPEKPTERLLQAVWYHQRIRRERLRLADGRELKVLHPGFWNREAGPDFRKAIVKLGEDDPVQGDVEIDMTARDWEAHGHAGNPDFQGVVLHVLWDEAGTSPLPVLQLRQTLDAPLEDLGEALATETGASLPGGLQGRCCRPLADLNADLMEELLEQAAICRFRSKAVHLEARAKEAGWEPALREGLFRALGYKNNSWPMQRLGELVPEAAAIAGGLDSVLDWQAVLLGLSGLLPGDLDTTGPAAGDYARKLWDRWWRWRGELAEFVLPRRIWRLSGLRPANHPQRRLALAAYWLARGRDLTRKVEAWMRAEMPPAKFRASLMEVLQAEEDPFWSSHYTMSSGPMPGPRPLLGEQRTTDLAVNVILPWIWSRARAGSNDKLRCRAEKRFLIWPRAEDNAILRLARQRLMGRAAKARVDGAAGQQGLLQIVQDFCNHSDSLCEQCPFPRLVRSLTEVPPK